MSAFVSEAYFVAGAGWTATVHAELIWLAVDPDADGDALPAAVEQLLSPTRRKFWLVEWSHQDAAGWDVYELRAQRDELRLVKP
jgi:hypothetical protein